MTKGDLGSDLHQILSERTHREVISIGIGGAGSMDYLRSPMVNNCCGYIIRETEASGEIVTVEDSNVLDNTVIGKKYHGSLSSLIQEKQPSSILIVLGTNQKNQHAKLLETIQSLAPHAAIAWAGPPQNSPALSESIQAWQELSPHSEVRSI